MAAAAVLSCRKRGLASFLDDDPSRFLDDPFQPLLGNNKRGRCSPSPAAIADLGLTSLEYDPVDALRFVFPDADPQILRQHLEASGNVLDAAIRGLKDFSPAAAAATATTAPGTNIPMPTDRLGWAELITGEMSSASDMIDAKNRALRVLELLEQSAAGRRGSSPEAATQKMREEHGVLKQMLGGALQQNGVLKRAFLVQHNRIKDYEDTLQRERAQFKDGAKNYEETMQRERAQFKEAAKKWQEQMKALQDRNYVLAAHLEQAKQQGGISGRCHPDVF